MASHLSRSLFWRSSRIAPRRPFLQQQQQQQQQQSVLRNPFCSRVFASSAHPESAGQQPVINVLRNGAAGTVDPKEEELVERVMAGKIKFHAIEQAAEGNLERAVSVRRQVVERRTGQSLADLQFQNYNYQAVHGQCCENVVGVMTVPVGIAGPLLVDGKEFHIPMATTEGALIASTTRGCKAISACGGARTEVVQDSMSRAPVLQAPDVRVAAEVKRWVESNFERIAETFNSTSRFARLKSVNVYLAGRKIFLRFKAVTGDAMGMNMVGKGVEKALGVLVQEYPSLDIVALSGNMCTDKKPSAINFIEGRGKSVVADCVIKGSVVRSQLHTTVEAMVSLNMSKNLVGSQMAGSIGGSNAHAANVVAAIFIATGQDPAQVVESSNCMTLMEPVNNGEDLYISVTMPCLEVGTVGGGTSLASQKSMLNLLGGIAGASKQSPGENARQLSQVIAASVMAGELSLMSALSSGHLISSHMRLNRHGGAPKQA